jgi:ABC-type bacteriocin/lantibiotic exporter with double-glycine peptidase domain
MTLLLDLLGIALIFPFLQLFVSPSVLQSNDTAIYFFNKLRFSSTEEFIIVIGAALIIVYLIKLILKTVVNKLKFHYTNRVTFRLSTHLFRGLLRAKYALFLKESTSEMVGIINAHTIHSMICLDSWIGILNEVLFLSVITGIFLIINPPITLSILTIFVLIGAAIYLGLVRKIALYGQMHTELNRLAYKFAYTVANSIKDIKIMGLEHNYADRFDRIWGDYNKIDSRVKTAKAVPRDFSETLIFSGMIAVCLYILISGKNLNDMIPLLGVVAVSAMRILPSFNKIIGHYNDYKYYKNSLSVVSDLYDKLESNIQTVDRLQLSFNSSLVLRNVSFDYEDKRVLDSISIDIPRGHSVAFVGLSGAGKSTILDILAGLQQVKGGEFTLDGHSFDPFRTDALRSRIGYVPQNVNLIDESIAYNISFEERYDSEQMQKVIQMARLTPFIGELPAGVDTIIGESGVRVSGGQRQRIGIARALYRNPEVLIFDEATSALDNVTERELMAEINALSGSKTLIIVAHRLSTVEKCDVIYLLERGEIVAKGTHTELLESSPVYQRMYHRQRH